MMRASLHRLVVLFTICTIVSALRVEAAPPAPGSFILYPERIVLKDGVVTSTWRTNSDGSDVRLEGAIA